MVAIPSHEKIYRSVARSSLQEMALPDTDRITFYDIPSTVPGSAWSPNTWKTRFALNYKGVPYRTEWVDYPDIAAFLSGQGVEPNPPSVAPWPYTLPAIYDPRSQKFIMYSYKIALYLDETYPDTPALLPSETRVLHAAFQKAVFSALHEKLTPLVVCRIATTALGPPNQKYFRATREAMFGCTLEELSPPGSTKLVEQWEGVENGFRAITSWIEAAGDGRLLLCGGPDGDVSKVSHADTDLAGSVILLRTLFGAESEEWRRVERFDGGRWKRYLVFFEQWADTSR